MAVQAIRRSNSSTNSSSTSSSSSWLLKRKRKPSPRETLAVSTQVRVSLIQSVFQEELWVLTASSSWKRSWMMIITQRQKKLKNMLASWAWTSTRTASSFSSPKKDLKRHFQAPGSHARALKIQFTIIILTPRPCRKSILAMTTTESYTWRSDNPDVKRMRRKPSKGKSCSKRKSRNNSKNLNISKFNNRSCKATLHKLLRPNSQKELLQCCKRKVTI